MKKLLLLTAQNRLNSQNGSPVCPYSTGYTTHGACYVETATYYLEDGIYQVCEGPANHTYKLEITNGGAEHLEDWMAGFKD